MMSSPDEIPNGFNNYLPPERTPEPWSFTAGTVFFITYALIFTACVVASGSAGEWSGASIAFGIVWGALCLPGWGIIFSFILDVKSKLRGGRP